MAKENTKENIVEPISGWVILTCHLLMAVVCFVLMILNPGLGGILIFVMIVTANGYFTLQPNESRLLILFGSYRGTVKQSGFFWANPFYSRGVSFDTSVTKNGVSTLTFKSKVKISLRLRTLNVPQLKVNDKQGNPIEIAAVIVWSVKDTARAAFDVDDYEGFVSLQSETALRHLANKFAYDNGNDAEVTLMSGVDEVSFALKNELQERLEKAGLIIEEARLTHLAYSPEIAGVMLRRQQAEAVIAARQKIVHGAVSMVQMALSELSELKVVDLDNERKAAMVSNLLVVLCSESEAQPVLNTGTLYN